MESESAGLVWNYFTVAHTSRTHIHDCWPNGSTISMVIMYVYTFDPISFRFVYVPTGRIEHNIKKYKNTSVHSLGSIMYIEGHESCHLTPVIEVPFL